MPTVKQDYIAYSSGASKTYLDTYNTYISSVEALDKAVRIITNIASMAEFTVHKETNGVQKPFKLTNIDFKYNINDQDSQGDFIGLVFASVFTHGGAVILAEKNAKTKYINFFVYDPSKFNINATSQNIIDHFEYSSQSGEQIKFKPEDVIYVAPRINPGNLVYAVSRLKPMTDLLTLQANVMKQQQDYYASGGKNSSIISPKEPLGETKANQLKTAFDTFLQTTATKTLFMNTEVDVASISNAQSPTQIMEALQKINTMILEMFGIPPYLYGDYAGYVNDAAVQTACKLFFQIQMKPVFNAFAFQMTRYFRNTLSLKDAVVSFDYTKVEILEDSLNAKIENASKLYKLGLMSMNEARISAELGVLPDEAANRHFVPAYLTGQVPVSIEQFDETISQLFNTSGTQMPTDSGTTGGEDNANPITDSQGGPSGN